MLPNPSTLRADTSPAHPPRAIRLGIDAETNGPLDLALPTDLAAHVFLPGASGSGKTSTVTRLADGTLANGYGVVIVDCKAGGLGNAARKLAARYGVPFNLVDPEDPQSLGYNPCTGDPASVANKLMGAFTFSPAAEIYKNIGMEIVPVIVRGLQAASEPVSLHAIYDALGTRGMENIALKITGDDRTRERLFEFGKHLDPTNHHRDRNHRQRNHRLAAPPRCVVGGQVWRAVSRRQHARLGQCACTAVRDLHRAQRPGQ